MSAQPYAYPVVLTPAPHPPPLPAGYGCLVFECGRGPYVIPVPSVAKLSVDGLQVPMSEGRWFVPVIAGQHVVKMTDFIGFPIMSTMVNVQPGTSEYRFFDPGIWRNRVKDGSGADVTKFGMWSNYAVLGIFFGVIALFALVCCVGGGLLSASGS